MIAWVGNQQFVKELTPHPALRQLRSIPSRPSRRTASARSRRNCMASPTLIGGGAARRIEFFPTVALPYSGEKGGGKRWRGVSKPKPYALCRKSGSVRGKE